MIKIFYGISQDNSIDVTDICLDRLRINNIINIPCTESTRATIFTDPYYGILKYIYILNCNRYNRKYKKVSILIKKLLTRSSIHNRIYSIVDTIKTK